jgi:isocitrate dehydrogenase
MFIIMNAKHTTHTVACASGDGIGPEILGAVQRILAAANAPIVWEPVAIGKQVYESGVSSGIAPEAWETIRTTKVLLKAPISTPQGGGYKSVNVTLRKSLGLYANIRPCVAYAPFVATLHPRMNLVIIRENEEDLYAGIEHRQTDDVYQCLKIVSRSGCEKIVRYAFEYARSNNRSKVTCMTKDNIMKLTDGLFHRVFVEISAEYPEIQTEHLIIDIGAARLAATPEYFDVIVTSNLYGDILSDIAAQLSGSVGLAGSMNVGKHAALFEAIHGSAPTIAGQNIANPSGLLLAAVQMLVHLGLFDTATTIHNAWLKTLESGVHTADVFRQCVSKQCVGTDAFTDAVIQNLGEVPLRLPSVCYYQTRAVDQNTESMPTKISPGGAAAHKELVGVDVFLHWRGTDPDELALRLKSLSASRLQLSMITNRGVKVWPNGLSETFCTDHWRCRFVENNARPISHNDLLALLNAIDTIGLDFIKTENLYEFDGAPGYTQAQGQ